MWQGYQCPFGCDEVHVETLASEAMAYWFGVHHKLCSAVDRDSDD
jgi:hypothetical protein